MRLLDFLIDYGFILMGLLTALVAIWGIAVQLKLKRLRNQRPQTMKRVATGFGMNFLGTNVDFSNLILERLADSRLLKMSDNENLFNRDKLVSILTSNLAHRELSSGHLFLFDYVRVSKSPGRKTRRHRHDFYHEDRQTIIFAQLNDHKFPTLLMQPNHVQNKLLSLVGLEELTSKSLGGRLSEYRVAAGNLEDAQCFLKEALQKELFLPEGLALECWEDNVLITRDNSSMASFRLDHGNADGRIGIIDSNELKQFLEDGTRLVTKLEKNATRVG